MAQEWEYFCTANAHDPATLTHHMNVMARAGWELLTVTFAIKGESGTHTLSGGAARLRRQYCRQPDQRSLAAEVDS
jgi:hypothetical protein